jgi:hypothetical protein
MCLNPTAVKRTWTRGAARASAIIAASALAIAASGGEPAKAIEDLEARGMGEAAPSEIETARELLEQGRDGLLGMQIDLLEAMAEAHDLEKQAEQAELDALDAELEARIEQAAYEFLVEQILASGVASYWSMP